ncbi:Anhydro-N-acetylmuramic acid kinase [hydrothermal vent metagenome]|uniref:Anhydro-N-acetylmuramic acid kinase n=1 Tax=hydrothermal vent metagenome TaxID=652676 RepID=A0A3B0WEB9_9ZZZZ
MPTSVPELYIGLMSGTSMDGIDAALVDFSTAQPRLISTHAHSWPETIQQALIKARDLPDSALFSLHELDKQIAEIFAAASLKLLANTSYQAQDITAIGNHGQTIRHRPDIEKPFSLQIGDAQILASLTGIDVISDFRTADIKAGGQGAPLVPAFHQAIFSDEKVNRVIVNIGGIANITALPKGKNKTIVGFDCGPGNTLMDAWITQHKQQPYDADGAFAASGKTNAGLLAKLLMDDYFQLAPPKSTGFEYFNLQWLNTFDVNEMNSADMQSTLNNLTATSIIRAINQYAVATDEIYICGGGVHNQTLMQRLETMAPCPVITTETLGIHPDWVEAMAFAWLAYQNIHQQTGNLPSVTGAKEAVILGNLTHPAQ